MDYRETPQHRVPHNIKWTSFAPPGWTNFAPPLTGLPMIGKLLGHTQVQTTARYAHLARDTVKASAARIGDSIDRDLDAAE